MLSKHEWQLITVVQSDYVKHESLVGYKTWNFMSSTLNIQAFRFSQRPCWTFKCSGKWRCVVQCVWQVALCRSVSMASGAVSFSAYDKWHCVVQCVWQVALCRSVHMASSTVSFSAYGKWRCVLQCVLTNILKDNSALTSRLKQSQKNQLLFLDRLTLQMKVLRSFYMPQLVSEQHSVTSQKNWNFMKYFHYHWIKKVLNYNQPNTQHSGRQMPK